MIVGIDFDNTIVCYDHVFYRESIERDLIPAHLPQRKEAIRDFLRQEGKEDLWTELQGYVYGPGIKGAEPFAGVIDFLRQCRSSGVKTYIISHKTKFPYAGTQYDLHESALDWLSGKGFYETGSTGLTASDVFFAPTKKDKLLKIAEQCCSHFIDDLPEFLGEDDFPPGVERILFDPSGTHGANEKFHHLASWADAARLVVGEPAR